MTMNSITRMFLFAFLLMTPAHALAVEITGIGPVEFRIFPVPLPSLPGVPVSSCAGPFSELGPLYPSTGWDEYGDPNVCAAINGPCPVANEETTWGLLKSMYR